MFFKVILFLASLGPLCCVRALWLWRAGALSGRGAGLLAAVGPLAGTLRLKGTLASVAVVPGLWSTDSVVETLGLSCLLQGM